jgi:hypothetical protein
VVLAQRCESLFKVVDEGTEVSGLDDHVIHVGFDILVASAFFNPKVMVV